MRIFLLLVILVALVMVNRELVFITGHYEYLERAYTSGLNSCLKTLEKERRK